MTIHELLAVLAIPVASTVACLVAARLKPARRTEEDRLAEKRAARAAARGTR